MSKRAGPPLFELLRERGESPHSGADAARARDEQAQLHAQPKAPQKPQPSAPAAEPKPAPRPARESDSGIPWSSGGVTRAERSAATFEDEPTHAGELRISSAKLYTAVAVALACIVVAWVAGYRIGHGAGKAEMTALLPDDPVVNPPRQINPGGTGNQAGTPSGGQSGTPAGAQTRPTNPSGNQTAPQQTQPPAVLPQNWALLADGLRAADPRVPGTNYLELATLPEEQALDALAFLASRGVRAIGSPVDSGGRSGNNPSRYTLYSLGLAVPSGQYSSTASERRDHERLVASIGADWMRDRRGGSNFSQTLWRRYDP